MAAFFDLYRVQALCHCNLSAPISQLHFCRHCLGIRCSNCVSHEVDSYYCPNCLENMASAEAKLRKHRCGNCFDCPCCGHTLLMRATLALVPVTDDPCKTTPRKAYYLACGFCRWTTRDCGLEDQRTPAGGWQQLPNPHAQRVEELVNAYSLLAVKEKNERERIKYARKRNYMLLMLSLAERYPVLTPRFKRCRTPAWSSLLRDKEPQIETEVPAAKAKSITEPFNVENLLKTPLILEHITSISQRYRTPHMQPTSLDKPQPCHKALAIKRSLRCRQCEHSLSKADFNPSSIKFRINFNAHYHVLDLRICMPAEHGLTEASDIASSLGGPLGKNLNFVKGQPLPLQLTGFAVGKETAVILVISNPALRITTFTIRQLTAEEEMEQLAAHSSLADSIAGDSSQSLCETVDRKSNQRYSTVQLRLPTTPIRIGAKSYVTDYDDLVQGDLGDNFKDDDPKLLAFRSGNKVGISIGVTPQPQVALSNSLVPVRAAIRLTFDYKNVILLSEQRAAASAALLQGSGIADSKALVESASSTSTSQTVDEIHDVGLVFLIDFGGILPH